MTPPELSALPLAAVLRVNARCDVFEAEWRAGRRPRAEDFAAGTTGPERAALLAHLAAVEAEYRGPAVGEFVRRLAAEGLLPDGWPSSQAGRPVPPSPPPQAGRPVPPELPVAQASRPVEEENAADLAAALVAAGHLTAYQARVLLSPRPHPLALDDYLILDRVAAGGMGTVYRATHRRMRRTVALKVASDGRGDEAERGRWFRREAEAAGRLTHPNIVTAYDAGEARGVAYLASEFVDGPDLRRWVAERGPLPVGEAVRAARDAAAGLAHAHRCGVVHRDVKPANLIRDPAGVVRVTDVGLARVGKGDGPPGDGTGVVGTLGYMAPEQASDPAAAGPRADIYALGRTLHFLLTGRPAGEVDPVSPRAVRADVPAAVDALVRRMTAARPAARPRSMAVVLAELEQLADPPPRRVGLALGGVLAMVAGGVGASLLVPSPPGPEPGKVAARPGPPVRAVPFDATAYQAEWAAAHGLPVEVEPLPGLPARLLPPGRFVMGTPAEVLDRWLAAETNPTARARLLTEAARPAAIESAVYIGTTEVTVALFRRFVEAQTPPYRTGAERAGGVGYRLAGGAWGSPVRGPSWRDAGDQPLTDDHPACNLGRDDAADFCRWVTIELDGRYVCRLPTEGEWEYACRAGSADLWATGPDPAGLGAAAWYAGTVDAADGRFRPVGRKAANRFGLFDLHGNLEEWCLAADGGGVLRGGNVRSPAGQVRSAARATAVPTEPRGGFRVVFEPRR